MDKTGPQGRSVAFEWLHMRDRRAHCPSCTHMYGVLAGPSVGGCHHRLLRTRGVTPLGSVVGASLSGGPLVFVFPCGQWLCV